MKRALVALLCLAAVAVGCRDITVTSQWICRGDTTPALADTNLVKCSTLDSLARRDTTRRP